MKRFDYDLVDDNGISSIELPVEMRVGSVFVCEYGTYIVMPTPAYVPKEYGRILCERISKKTIEDS